MESVEERLVDVGVCGYADCWRVCADEFGGLRVKRKLESEVAVVAATAMFVGLAAVLVVLAVRSTR